MDQQEGARVQAFACMLVAGKGGVPYIKPKKNGLVKAKGCWSWKCMATLFRRHPHLFNCVYRLHQRAETGWLSLKSLVKNLVGRRTIQTVTTNRLLQPHLYPQRKPRILSQICVQENFKYGVYSRTIYDTHIERGYFA